MPLGLTWRIGPDGFYGSGWGETMKEGAHAAPSDHARERRLASTGPGAASYEIDPELRELEAEKPETFP